MTEQHAVIKRDFLPVDLHPLLQSAGLDGCMAVQARQMVKETEWLLNLADQNPWIHGVVGWVPLAEKAAEPYLERYAEHPKLCAVRHVVHDEPDDDFILRTDFNEGISKLADYNLIYDVLIFAKHLPQTIAFADRHPNQPFVVDHIAKPTIQATSLDQAWATNLRELARREQVNCKLSGMVTEVCDPAWNTDSLRPYVDTVLEAFGPSRLMFGSDWPVCLLRATYQAWIDAVTDLLSSLSADEQTAIWGTTAERVYKR